MSAPLRFLIGHKCQRGKDTSADYIISKYGGVKFKFASPLYQICSYMQRVMDHPVTKEPPLMQATADVLRGLWGDDCFARHQRRCLDELCAINPSCNIIISDFRHLIEREVFHDFVTICINRDIETTDRDSQHSSETELDNFAFDYVVDNNGSEDDLKEQLDAIVSAVRKSRR